MTSSVADKTAMSEKVWRRHQDPPGLWIGVAIGSLSLHLLMFWLMRSPGTFRPWFTQPGQDIVAVELIETSPEKSTDETKSPPTSTTPDEQSVNLGESDRQDNNQNASPTDTQVFAPETPPQAEPTPTPTPEATQPTPTPTQTPETRQSTPIIPPSDRPWERERRQEIELGKGTPLPSDTPPVTPEQITESEPVEGTTPRNQDEETANNSSPEPPANNNGDIASNSGEQNSSSTGENSSNSSDVNTPSTPNGETTDNSSNVNTPSTPNGETSSNPSDNTSNPETTNTPAPENSPTANPGGGWIASVSAIGDSDARQLIQQGKIRNIDIPDVFAVYAGSSTKSLDDSSSYLPSNSTLQPARLLVSLIIDQNGNFQQAQVLELPSNLQSEKSSYEQLVNDLFKNDRCTPAKNQDGTPKDLSNCYIWIDIEPRTSN